MSSFWCWMCALCQTMEINSRTGDSELTGRCLCHRGWRGRLCSRPKKMNAWSSWTSWSACIPACQPTSQGTWLGRFRVRKRRCLDPQGDCGHLIQESDGKKRLDVEERKICRSRPCDRYLRVTVPNSQEKDKLAAASSAVSVYICKKCLNCGDQIYRISSMKKIGILDSD